MEFRTKIIQKFNTLSNAQNILYHFIDDWILFQRNNFDHYDESGDPFVCQIFLIEISSGRYIHRSQGQKVDQGTTQEIDYLIAKLTHVFFKTKPCSGVPIQNDWEQTNMLVSLDYPFQRYTSKGCQFYYDASQIKISEHWTSCPSCQEKWLDISSKRKQEIEEQEYLNGDPLEVSNSNEIMSCAHEGLLKAEDDESTTPSTHFDHNVLDTIEVEDLWSERSITPERERPEDEKCDLSVESKSALSSKNKGNQKGQLYNCQCCSLSFGSALELARHRRSRKWIQRVQRKVGCLDCDKEIDTFRQLAKHVAKDHPQKQEEYEKFQPKEQDPSLMKEPKKCSVCDFTTNSGALNFRHIELYHKLGNHLCPECQEPNLTYYDLMIHNYRKHRKPTEYLSPNLIGLDVITLEDGKVQLKRSLLSKCHLCLREYKTDCGLVSHLRRKHSWGMFRCDPCDESCQYSMDLSAHVIQFHGDNPVIKCPNCQIDFNLKDDPKVFNKHYDGCHMPKIQLNGIEGDKKAFQCHICGKHYKMKRDLRLHIDAHQGAFQYVCHHCGFGTNYKHVFENHEQTHLTKEERKNASHKCKQCGKLMKTVKLLKRHVRVVHEGKKPNFKCKGCGEFFKHFVALNKHRQSSGGVCF